MAVKYLNLQSLVRIALLAAIAAICGCDARRPENARAARPGKTAAPPAPSATAADAQPQQPGPLSIDQRAEQVIALAADEVNADLRISRESDQAARQALEARRAQARKKRCELYVNGPVPGGEVP